MHDVIMVIHFYLAGRLYWLLGISALKLGEKCNMDILARFVDKEEKILVKLIIVSAHVLERISQVANTGVELKRYIILSKAQVSERMIQIVSPV